MDLAKCFEVWPGMEGEDPLHFVHAKIPRSKPDQSAKGYSLYLALETASGLQPGVWIKRLRRLNRLLVYRPQDPAFGHPQTKQPMSGADLMNTALIPRMRAIAGMSPPMPSTNYLKSVDWTHIQLRSFRRAGIHRLRILKTDKDVINYFGRWKADKKEAMQMRYDRMAIQESVNATAAM